MNRLYNLDTTKYDIVWLHSLNEKGIFFLFNKRTKLDINVTPTQLNPTLCSD